MGANCVVDRPLRCAPWTRSVIARHPLATGVDVRRVEADEATNSRNGRDDGAGMPPLSRAGAPSPLLLNSPRVGEWEFPPQAREARPCSSDVLSTSESSVG